MDWFRCYHEVRNDPKLASFTKAQRWDWMTMLCLANEAQERGIIALDDEDLAAALSLSAQEFTEFTDRLEKKRMIHRTEEGLIVITHWDTRQRSSDSSLDRVKRWRSRHSNGLKPDCNVTVTPSRADSRAEDRTEQNRTDKSKTLGANAPKETAGSEDRGVLKPPVVRAPTELDLKETFSVFWTAFPFRKERKNGKDAAWKWWCRAKPDPAQTARLMAALEAQKRTKEWLDGFIPDPVVWLRNKRWEDEIVSAPTQPPALSQYAPYENEGLDDQGNKRYPIAQLKRMMAEGKV